MPKTDNPLAQFFRQPAIYIRLPSQGTFWPEGSLNMPPNGELPVYPMTAIDEITYRTPDALFNGEAVMTVIKSCIPNIIDPWKVPSIDFDTVLVAIRIASYGHQMEIGTKCPACQAENEFGLDLRTVIDGLKSANYELPLTIGDLNILFRPLDYREMTDNNQLQFEQQKTLQMLGDQELTEDEKVSQLNTMMKRIMEVTVRSMAHSIKEIRTRDTSVIEIDYIIEFLNNCDRTVFEAIKNRVLKLKEDSELKPLKINCPDCQHEYDQMFTLDMANFFGPAS